MIPSLRRLQMFHLPSVSVLDGEREARWECQPNAKKACYGNCPSMSIAVGRVSWGESWVTLWRYIILILDFVKGKRNRWRVYVVITTFFLWGANCRLQTRIMKTNSTFHQCPFWAPWWLFLGWLLTLFGSFHCLQKTTTWTSDHAPAPARKVLPPSRFALARIALEWSCFFLPPPFWASWVVFVGVKPGWSRFFLLFGVWCLVFPFFLLPQLSPLKRSKNFFKLILKKFSESTDGICLFGFY